MKNLVRKDVLSALQAQSQSARISAVESLVREEGYDPLAVYHEHVIIAKDGCVYRAGFSVEEGTPHVDLESMETMHDVMITEEEANREIEGLFEEFTEKVLSGDARGARERLRAASMRDARYTEV